MPTIRVTSSAGPYDVYCASGAIARSASLVAAWRDDGVFTVSSPRVWGHWGKAVSSGLGAGRGKQVILFDDAESAKRLASVEEIARQLVRAGADRRRATIVAVGGGVVGDGLPVLRQRRHLRGVRLVHIPTTLVAQIDSSIGGKTGVNLPEGKNLVGAFYPPKLIIVDPAMLSTLASPAKSPLRPLRGGQVRSAIADRGALRLSHKSTWTALLRRDPAGSRLL